MYLVHQHLAGVGRWTQLLRQRFWLLVVILLWAAAVGLSWRIFLDYDFSGVAAPLAATSARWPSTSRLTLAQERPTILFFIHPKCPCTRASLAELERLWVLRDDRNMIRSPRLLVVATVPPDASADWLTTDTLQRVQQLPDATVVIDRDGREAQRFGATSSGTVMWFGAAGHRLYAGGITASRGHEGDNVGLASVAALLQGHTTAGGVVPALGCRLCLPATENSSHSLTGD